MSTPPRQELFVNWPRALPTLVWLAAVGFTLGALIGLP